MARAMMFFSSFFFSLLLSIHSYAMIISSPGRSSSSNGAGDELALLSFKSTLPSALQLASWNTSGHYCSWPGVACGSRHLQRVVSLRLGSFNLSGHVSPFLGNLSFLRELDLGDNQLVGQIPPELGRLVRLQVLNLSYNQLQGEIPAEIGISLKNLVYLNLGQNSLSGEIPPSLSELPLMEQLTLYYNRLSGEIPPALSNLTNLRVLHLDFNMLSGAIPSSFGLLPSLSRLTLGGNNLSGTIPDSFWNISSLTSYSVQQNMLNGTMPPDAFSNLPNLQSMFMDHNFFHGPIPRSIANASELWIVQLGSNSFSGIVPPEIGRLTNLQRLVLLETLLEAKEPKDWEFFTALTNCSQLQFLELGVSRFGGILPDSVSNLSTSLIQLNVNDNTISGSIPDDISNLKNLQYFDLSKNSFTGSLPSSLGNLTELNYMNLESNSFSGRIPSTLGNLGMLELLVLSSNNFAGQVPVELFNSTAVSVDLSYNNLEGSIPQEISNLKGLIEFYAQWNKLSGEIPSTIGECQLLQNLHLQNNILNGTIPSSLGQLQGLENLDLSNNNLSGEIPKLLGNLSMLYYLNLSFNNFVGQVPTFGVFANATAISIQGNDMLCGGTPHMHLPPCSSQLPKNKHTLVVIPIVLSLVATVVALALLYIMLRIRCKKSRTETSSTTSMQGHPLISYSQLVKATDGFSSTNLLGSGAFGSVYRGELDGQSSESANLVAVKVLKLQNPGALKSFTAECEALRNLRHRNLVKIVTACSSIDTRGNDFRAIVFEFMPNGSLEGWLHPDANEETEQRNLNILERVTILLDVAYALDYLHCHGPAPVVHCDIKSSNVLLDADMVAHVGDFGLARILVEGNSFLQESSSSIGFRGTIGYAAPEYGAGNTSSTHGDIYSYGMLVLETVTGERPTDSKFMHGLREYVELGMHDGVADIVDTRLSLGLHTDTAADGSSHKGRTDFLVSLLRLGLSCSQEMPSNRMSTGDIIKELSAIRQSLL
uniref:Receptor kinase-like protein Xa21 n=1 Tax=Oryza nivara TaxID=4536 RepID=A0A0E0IUH5_ORYNI